jgi:hypothetical protein
MNGKDALLPRKRTKWKQGFLVAYARGVDRQHTGATDKPFSQVANLVTLPAARDVMDALAGALDNLALVATSERTTVQQLTLANLSMVMSVATLTATNKKLTETAACCNLVPQGCSSSKEHGGKGARYCPKAIWGNCCWTHGYKVLHTSKTCNVIGRKLGHNEAAMVVDTKGGADSNKDWYLQGNQAP